MAKVRRIAIENEEGAPAQMVDLSAQGDITFETSQEEVPSVVDVPNLRPGFVAIKHKTIQGQPIMVKSNHVGTIYTLDEWEIITEKKS